MNNIINVLKAIKNPEQAKQLMLDNISKTRPDIANNLKLMMKNGVPPQQALRQAINNGQITYNDFKNMKSLLASYGRFLPFKISQKELNELESEFNTQHFNQTRF